MKLTNISILKNNFRLFVIIVKNTYRKRLNNGPPYFDTCISYINIENACKKGQEKANQVSLDLSTASFCLNNETYF